MDCARLAVVEEVIVEYGIVVVVRVARCCTGHHCHGVSMWWVVQGDERVGWECARLVTRRASWVLLTAESSS